MKLRAIVIGIALATMALVMGGAYWTVGRIRLSEFPGQCNQANTAEDWEQLEVIASEWTQRDSQSAMAWFWLGKSQQRQLRFQESIESLEHVPLDGPRGIDAANLRVEILLHGLHRPLQSLKVADEVLQVEPGNVDALRNRIFYFAMTMQRPAMVADIRKAIEVGGDLPEHYVYMINLDDLWFLDGADIVQKWREQEPGSLLLRAAELTHKLKRGRAALLTTPGPKAEQDYDQALAELAALDSESRRTPQVLEFRMIRASDLGDVEEMGRCLTEVSDQLSDDPVFWYYRAWYASRVQRSEEAQTSLAEALRLNPLSPLSRHLLSQLLREKGDTDGAAREAALASRGTTIITDIRRLPHLSDAPPPLLREIAELARQCGDFPISGGIHRHQDPNVR